MDFSPVEKTVEVKLGGLLEIGHRESLFGSIASVAEDKEGNFYVLDRKEFKVFRFSPQGRLLQTFGQKGQGPGDFQSPSRLVFTSSGELAVLEDTNYISFLKPDGTFIRRLDLQRPLGLGYVGPDRFYGWIWRPEDRQQLMVDGKDNALATFHTKAREAFSVTLPDESGRRVMFNYDNEFYVPQFLFAHGRGLNAVGISSTYDLTLLDENGRIVASLKRELKPAKINKKEKAYLEREIREFAKARGWPDRVSRELVKKIPEVKNIIRAVRISPQHILIFRFRSDLTQEDAPIPVDIFTTAGHFLGTAEIRAIPLFISENSMYFSKSDDTGNVFLIKADYSLAGR
jgi:hypothetical protein